MEPDSLKKETGTNARAGTEPAPALRAAQDPAAAEEQAEEEAAQEVKQHSAEQEAEQQEGEQEGKEEAE
ncbi:MAG: hypothetical protein GY772_16910, partial [bacterium]|nr:hypothetical protein [bacterium]